MQEKTTMSDLIPLSKYNKYYDFPTINSIRQLRFYNINNFNAKVVRKIGKRLYIDTYAFKKWVENGNINENKLNEGESKWLD